MPKVGRSRPSGCLILMFRLAPGWTRTNDQRINSPTLYQLSYREAAWILRSGPKSSRTAATESVNSQRLAHSFDGFPESPDCRHTIGAYARGPNLTWNHGDTHLIY